VSMAEALSNNKDAAGLDDIHDDLDDLVDDINEEWQQGNVLHGDKFNDVAGCSNNIEKAPTVEVVKLDEVHIQQGISSATYDKNEELALKHSCSCQVGSGLVKQGKVLASNTLYSSKSNHSKRKKAGVPFKHSAGFIKKIARLPLKDRKEILKVLKKHECKRSVLAKASKAMATSNSISSNTSNALVHKEWEHWVVLHDKKEVAEEDVREIGKTLGVDFEGCNKKSLNLLTREGRKELRAERGSLLLEGDVEVGGSGREGV